LVTEQTRIVNQIKAVLVRFGIRTFRPTLRKAEEKLESLRERRYWRIHARSWAATWRGYGSYVSRSRKHGDD
jgi:transposase